MWRQTCELFEQDSLRILSGLLTSSPSRQGCGVFLQSKEGLFGMIILASAFIGSYAKPAKSEWYILDLSQILITHGIKQYSSKEVLASEAAGFICL